MLANSIRHLCYTSSKRCPLRVLNHHLLFLRVQVRMERLHLICTSSDTMREAHHLRVVLRVVKLLGPLDAFLQVRHKVQCLAGGRSRGW